MRHDRTVGKLVTDSETALARGREGDISPVTMYAHRESVVVAFLINPDAPVTCAGTIGW